MMRWIILLLLLIASCAHAPENIVSANVTNVTDDLGAIEEAVGYAKVREIDVGLSTFLVEGYVLGTGQLAHFEQLIGKLEFNAADEITGVAAIVRADSLVTDLRLLDDELKKDVLAADTYNSISFRSTSIKKGTMKGRLEFRGVSKEIDIPVVIENGELKGEFLLDLTEFGVEKKGLDPKVRVLFELVHKPR